MTDLEVILGITVLLQCLTLALSASVLRDLAARLGAAYGDNESEDEAEGYEDMTRRLKSRPPLLG